MVRLAFSIGLLALFAPASAGAGRGGAEQPVHITSRPAGADVYVDGRWLGSTPLQVRLPRGYHDLELRRDGFESAETAIEVTRDRRRNRVRIRMQRATHGHIEVGPPPDLEGARVLLDGIEVDPFEAVRVEPGAYLIEVEKPGHRTYEEWVMVRAGEKFLVSVELTRVGPERPLDSELPVELGGKPEDDRRAAKPRRARDAAAPLVVVGGGFEVVARTFRYDNPQTERMRDFEAALPGIRLDAQVYPLARLGNPYLAGLGLTASLGRSMAMDAGTSDGMSIPATGVASDFGARYQVPLAGWLLGGSAGLGRRAVSFDDASPLAAEVPGVDYRFIRAGVDAARSLSGRHRAFGAANLLVLQATGPLGERFASSTVNGASLSAGWSTEIARGVALELTGAYSRFGHRYQPGAASEFVADGGVDQFVVFSVGGAYRY